MNIEIEIQIEIETENRDRENKSGIPDRLGEIGRASCRERVSSPV